MNTDFDEADDAFDVVGVEGDNRFDLFVELKALLAIDFNRLLFCWDITPNMAAIAAIVVSFRRRSALLEFELLDGFEVVAVEYDDDGDADDIEIDRIGSHFISNVRSFGDTHFTFATFFTGNPLFRFDVLFSGLLMPLAASLSALLLLLLLLLLDDETDGRIDDVGVVELLTGDLLLSLDEFVGSVVSLFCSVFGIFGNCTKGESVLGMRGVR